MKKTKLKLKQNVKNALCEIGIYALIVISIIAINARFKDLNNEKNDQPPQGKVVLVNKN